MTNGTTAAEVYEHAAITLWAETHTDAQDAPRVMEDEQEREEHGARYRYLAAIDTEDPQDPHGYYVEEIEETTPPACMHDVIITPADERTRREMEAHRADIVNAGLVYITDEYGCTLGAGCFERSIYPWCDPTHALYLALHGGATN